MTEKGEESMTQARRLTVPTGETIVDNGPGDDGQEYTKSFYNPEPVCFYDVTSRYNPYRCGNREHIANAYDLAGLIIERQMYGHMDRSSYSTTAIADTAIGACGCVIVGDGFYMRSASYKETSDEDLNVPSVDENLTTV
jgi:hypothetical protein